MKKLIFLAVALVLFFSCTKNKTQTVVVDCTAVKYSTIINSIVSSKCAIAGCHVSGSDNGNFINYVELYARYTNGTLAQKILVDKSMPEGNTLTDAELQEFTC